jgi:hypothetical protein
MRSALDDYDPAFYYHNCMVAVQVYHDGQSSMEQAYAYLMKESTNRNTMIIEENLLVYPWWLERCMIQAVMQFGAVELALSAFRGNLEVGHHSTWTDPANPLHGIDRNKWPRCGCCTQGQVWDGIGHVVGKMHSNNSAYRYPAINCGILLEAKRFMMGYQRWTLQCEVFQIWLRQLVPSYHDANVRILRGQDTFDAVGAERPNAVPPLYPRGRVDAMIVLFAELVAAPSSVELMTKRWAGVSLKTAEAKQQDQDYDRLLDFLYMFFFRYWDEDDVRRTSFKPGLTYRRYLAKRYLSACALRSHPKSWMAWTERSGRIEVTPTAIEWLLNDEENFVSTYNA